MPKYTVAARTTVTSSGAAAAELRTGAGRGCWLLSVEWGPTGSTANAFGIGRPAAIGITPTTQVLFQPVNVSDVASGTNLATAWTTPPTVPTNFLRRINQMAQQGCAPRLEFGRGVFVPLSSGLVLWNLAVGIGTDMQMEIEE